MGFAVFLTILGFNKQLYSPRPFARAAKRCELTNLHGHTEFVYSVCLVPHLSAVLSASADNTLRLHAVRFSDRGLHGESGLEFLGHRAHVTACGVVDGRVLSASVDDELRIWDLASAECLDFRRGLTGSGVSALAFDGLRMASGNINPHGVFVYDLTDLRPVLQVADPMEVYAVDLPPATNCLWVACGDSRLRCFDIRSGKLAQSLQVAPRGSARAVHSCGDLVCCGSADGFVRLFDARQGALIKAVRHHSEGVNAVRFDREKSLLISGSDGGSSGGRGLFGREREGPDWPPSPLLHLDTCHAPTCPPPPAFRLHHQHRADGAGTRAHQHHSHKSGGPFPRVRLFHPRGRR